MSDLINIYAQYEKSISMKSSNPAFNSPVLNALIFDAIDRGSPIQLTTVYGTFDNLLKTPSLAALNILPHGEQIMWLWLESELTKLTGKEAALQRTQDTVTGVAQTVYGFYQGAKP